MPKPKITEHALLRYCERVMGADRAWIAERIASQLPTSRTGAPLDGTHKIEQGRFSAIVKDGTIITVTNPYDSSLRPHIPRHTKAQRKAHRQYQCD